MVSDERGGEVEPSRGGAEVNESKGASHGGMALRRRREVGGDGVICSRSPEAEGTQCEEVTAVEPKAKMAVAGEE